MQSTSESFIAGPLPSAEVFAEAVNDGILLVNRDWKIFYSNVKAQQLLRCSSTNLANRDLWEIIDLGSNTSAQQQLLRAAQQQVTVEIDVFHPKLYTWHEVRAVPSAQGLILVLRDVTERQWLIHREAERTYLRNLFMDAPVAMSVTRGFHHQFEFVNHEGKKLIANRNVEGLIFREAFPEVVEQGFLEILDRVYQTGETYQAKNQLVIFDRHGTGMLEEAHFDLSYQALKGFNGKVSGILNISIEV